MNIFRKGKMWKVEGSSAKFRTEAEAKAFLESKAHVKIRQRIAQEDSKPIAETIKEAEEVIEKEDTSNWSPLEKLAGQKIAVCDMCECNPCECEEWNSVEETSSETESSTEDLS